MLLFVLCRRRPAEINLNPTVNKSDRQKKTRQKKNKKTCPPCLSLPSPQTTHISSLPAMLLCQLRPVSRIATHGQIRFTRVFSVNRSFRREHPRNDTLGFSQPTTVLFLAGLFPEPNASAAGVRTQFLVKQLAQTPGVESIHYGTGAKPTPNDSHSSQQLLKSLGVQFHHVPANDSDQMGAFLNKCGALDPKKSILVIIDRFYAEEAYSFHILNQCPHAAIVLDMQDMHSLRWHRQSIIEARDLKHSESGNDPLQQMNDPLSNLPTGKDNYPSAQDTRLQRELASIHRTDLTLVCSPTEMGALHSTFQISKDKLALASFFIDTLPDTSETLPFDQRKDFVFIGGFRHDPNVDAVRQMHRLWPQIREALGNDNEEEAHFHVYGPFCPRPLREACHNPSEGFHIHGLTNKSVEEILGDKKVVLAPLRFGAGIKGKIVEAWTVGTPVVTSSIGSEGMGDNRSTDGEVGPNEWGGFVASSSQEFVECAVSLYQDEDIWKHKSQKGNGILSNLYGIHQWESVVARLADVCHNLEERRQHDFMRGILWQQTTRSTEYFSKWIEAKNKT